MSFIQISQTGVWLDFCCVWLALGCLHLFSFRLFHYFRMSIFAFWNNGLWLAQSCSFTLYVQSTRTGSEGLMTPKRDQDKRFGKSRASKNMATALLLLRNKAVSVISNARHEYHKPWSSNKQRSSIASQLALIERCAILICSIASSHSCCPRCLGFEDLSIRNYSYMYPERKRTNNDSFMFLQQFEPAALNWHPWINSTAIPQHRLPIFWIVAYTSQIIHFPAQQLLTVSPADLTHPSHVWNQLTGDTSDQHKNRKFVR